MNKKTILGVVAAILFSITGISFAFTPVYVAPGGGINEAGTYTGNKTITGTMHVNGSSDFDGAVNIDGAATVGGNMNVAGVFTTGIIMHQNGSVIAAATTITPVAAQFHVNGTTAIVNITAPAACISGCEIVVIPDAVWTTTTAGNIALATTAVVNRAIKFVYDAVAVKWYPSY